MKRGLGVLVVLSLILILSLTFVSAGFFNNLFGKVTGEAIAPPLKENGEVCNLNSECKSNACDYDIFTYNNVAVGLGVGTVGSPYAKYCHATKSACLFY